MDITELEIVVSFRVNFAHDRVVSITRPGVSVISLFGGDL